MKAAELLEILDKYFMDAKIIATHPLSYVRALDLDERALFMRGATFMVLSIGVAFFILIPVFWAHGRMIEPGTSELLNLFGLVVFGLLSHLTFRLLGGAGTLRETIGVYGFVAGAVTPLRALLLFPVAMKFGPEFVLLPSGPELQKFSDGLNPSQSDLVFLVWFMLGSSLFLSVLTLIFAIPSLASVHRIGYVRCLAALLIPTVLVVILVSGFTSGDSGFGNETAEEQYYLPE